MAPKVTSSDEPLEDRSARHQRELADLRLKLASIVKIVFTAIAVILALGALLVVLGKYISPDNSVVKLVLHIANVFDGPFSRHHGVFTFTGKNAQKLDAAVNWGLAAIVYLIIGSVLRRILEPKTSTTRK